MKQNVGKIDKIARVVVGLALLSLLFVLEGSARWFGLVGLVPLATAAMGFCPLYPLVGLNTCCAGEGGEGKCCGGGSCGSAKQPE
jgi:hypothetical protein